MTAERAAYITAAVLTGLAITGALAVWFGMAIGLASRTRPAANHDPISTLPQAR